MYVVYNFTTCHLGGEYSGDERQECSTNRFQVYSDKCLLHISIYSGTFYCSYCVPWCMFYNISILVHFTAQTVCHGICLVHISSIHLLWHFIAQIEYYSECLLHIYLPNLVHLTAQIEYHGIDLLYILSIHLLWCFL